MQPWCIVANRTFYTGAEFRRFWCKRLDILNRELRIANELYKFDDDGHLQGRIAAINIAIFIVYMIYISERPIPLVTEISVTE